MTQPSGANPLPFALPANLDHTPDLSALSPGERLKFLRKAMVAAFHNGGWPAVRALQERHPEAAGLALKVDALAFPPKPKGYYAAVGKMVGAWLARRDCFLGQALGNK